MVRVSVQLTIRRQPCPASLTSIHCLCFAIWYDPPIMTNRLLLLTALLVAPVVAAEDSDQLLSIDHYVRVKSTVPSIAGQISQIYVRERARAATPLRNTNLADRVVLFVHCAVTPSEVVLVVLY